LIRAFTRALISRPKFAFLTTSAAKKHYPHDPDLNVRLGHVTRILRASKIVTTGFNIRGSWEETRFGHVKREEALYFYVNEHKIRNSTEFEEMWQIDYSGIN
jgi:hypothetical protein